MTTKIRKEDNGSYTVVKGKKEIRNLDRKEAYALVSGEELQASLVSLLMEINDIPDNSILFGNELKGGIGASLSSLVCTVVDDLDTLRGLEPKEIAGFPE